MNLKKLNHHIYPTCDIPGCNSPAHNKNTKVEPEYRTYEWIKTAFGGKGLCCAKHHDRYLSLNSHQRRHILNNLSLILEDEQVDKVNINKLW